MRTHQINIYELISVCPYPDNMQMFSETADSSQTKLIGWSLLIGEHGIGYSNLAFEPNKGQKRLIFSFKPLKCLDWLRIRSQSIDVEKFQENVIFIWSSWLKNSKFRPNTQIQKSSLEKDLWILAFVANKGQNKGRRSVYSIQHKWCWPRQSWAMCIHFNLRHILRHSGTCKTGPKELWVST